MTSIKLEVFLKVYYVLKINIFSKILDIYLIITCDDALFETTSSLFIPNEKV